MSDKRPFSTEAQNTDGGQNGRRNIQITNITTIIVSPLMAN